MSEQELPSEVREALDEIHAARPGMEFDDILRWAILTLARTVREDKMVLTREDLEVLMANAGAHALSRHIGRRVVVQPLDPAHGGGDFVFYDTGEALPTSTTH